MSESVGAPVVGVNYFDHQFLRQADFQAAANHHVSRARQHNALLHRFGVVAGLDVTFDAGVSELLISPGAALDPAGRELTLRGPSDAEALPRVSVQVGTGLEREVQPTDTVASERAQLDEAGLRLGLAGLPTSRRAFVTVRQEPRPIRPTGDLGFSLDDPQHTRTVERPVVTVAPTAPDAGDPDLLLAALDIDADGAVTVDLGGRAQASATLATGAVTASELAEGAVTESKLADAAVSTRALADGAVTNAALAPDAVGAANLQANAVSASRIQSNAVTTGKLANEAVTRPKLGADALALLAAAHCSFDGVGNAMRSAVGIKATRTGVGEYTFEAEIDVADIAQGCPIFVFAYREARVNLPASGGLPAETVPDGAQLRVEMTPGGRAIKLRVLTHGSGRPLDGRVNLLLFLPGR